MNTLDYTKLKVRAVIETIDTVRELDYPYGHALDAVNFIRKHFKGIESHLDSISEPANVRSICRQASEDIDNFLLAIGFLVRACDVRGALELQGPLLRLTHKAIGPDIRLVVSSEWRFSPFTLLYPGEFGNQFVLVGLPVSEAGNPLIAPLAGHELGHNIWRRLANLQAFVGQQIENAVKESIKNELWKEYSELFHLSDKEDLDQQELFGDISWHVATAWGVSQCEEMFCDFIGLSIFGVAYLHAFQYLISPGGGFRNPAYPGMAERVDALIQAAKVMKVEPPKTFTSEFDDSDTSPDPRHQLLLRISDKASLGLVDALIELAKDFCKDHEISCHDDADTLRICAMFKTVVPAVGAKSLANIVNAAWNIFLDPTNHWARDYPVTESKPEKRFELLRELALKSFEVYEIERLQEIGNATVGQ